MEQNQEYFEFLSENVEGADLQRDTSIVATEVTEVGDDTFTIQLTFNNITQVSKGGIEYLDELTMKIVEPKMI